MRRWNFAAALAGTLLLFAGCSGEGGDADRPAESSPVAPAADGAVEQVKAAGGEATAFGESYAFEDGLSVSVGEPEEFIPSPKATTGGEGQYVEFTIRLVNETDAPVKPKNVFVTVTSADGQGGDVVDKKRGLTGPPSRPLKPGAEVTWAQGFGVLDPGDVAVVVQVGMERVPVAFTR